MQDDDEILDDLAHRLGDDREELEDVESRVVPDVAPWRHDVRSAFVQRPDGSLVDRDELVTPTDPPAA